MTIVLVTGGYPVLWQLTAVVSSTRQQDDDDDDVDVNEKSGRGSFSPSSAALVD